MTDLEISILRVLRIFGPISNADIARRLEGMVADKTYPILKCLVARGLACHPKKQRWDITDRGRRFFDLNGINEPALFREGP